MFVIQILACMVGWLFVLALAGAIAEWIANRR